MRNLTTALVLLLLTGCVWNEAVIGPRIEQRTSKSIDGVVTTETISQAASYQGKRAKDVEVDDVWVESPAAGPTEARAGGLTFTGLPLPAASEMKPLYIIGGLCIVAGVIVGWLAGWGLGLAIAGAGLSLIATATLFDRYPWVALLPVVGGGGVGVWVLVDLYHGKKAREALAPIVSAIETSSTAAQVEVKKKVAQFAGPKKAKVKETISKLKGALGHA